MYNLENFSKVRVLVIGDVMIDKYLWGEVRRISPEAPVPVVNLKSQTLIAGGAANVAANVAALNAVPFLIGLIGDDSDGDTFGQILSEAGVSDQYIIRTKSRQTIVKTRIMAHNQQIARLDQETIADLSDVEQEEILEKIEALTESIDIIIVSDYGKGLISSPLMSRLINYSKEDNKILMVDPKGRNYGKYTGAFLMTPNKFELAEVSGCASESSAEIELAALKMLRELELQSLIVTRGEEGLTLFSNNEDPRSIRALKRKVYDVTGAGDTFISALGVAFAAGNNLEVSAEIANTAAGLVVEDLGTTVIKFDNLRTSLNNQI